MTRSNFRIPCITTAALVLGGGACGGSKASTSAEGARGVDTSSERIRAVAREICESEQRCTPADFSDSYTSVDNCVETQVESFPLSGRSGEDVQKCQDALLDLAVCYADAACDAEDEEIDDACGDLYETYADLCAGFGIVEEVDDFSRTQPSRRFRIPR